VALLRAAAQLVGSFLGASIKDDALPEAIAEMESMCVNEGQSSALSNLIPEFQQNAEASVDEGWTDVSCDPYCDFIGEIIEAGNSIMAHAYAVAQALSELGGDGEEYEDGDGESED
jgi:hypothetical protein